MLRLIPLAFARALAFVEGQEKKEGEEEGIQTEFVMAAAGRTLRRGGGGQIWLGPFPAAGGSIFNDLVVL